MPNEKSAVSGQIQIESLPHPGYKQPSSSPRIELPDATMQRCKDSMKRYRVYQSADGKRFSYVPRYIKLIQGYHKGILWKLKTTSSYPFLAFSNDRLASPTPPDWDLQDGTLSFSLTSGGKTPYARIDIGRVETDKNGVKRLKIYVNAARFVSDQDQGVESFFNEAGSLISLEQLEIAEFTYADGMWCFAGTSNDKKWVMNDVKGVKSKDITIPVLDPRKASQGMLSHLMPRWLTSAKPSSPQETAPPSSLPASGPVRPAEATPERKDPGLYLDYREWTPFLLDEENIKYSFKGGQLKEEENPSIVSSTSRAPSDPQKTFVLTQLNVLKSLNDLGIKDLPQKQKLSQKITAEMTRWVATQSARCAEAVVDKGAQPQGPQPDVLEKGAEVYYTQNDGSLVATKIVEVHYDQIPPYYTVDIDGNERQVPRDRLSRVRNSPGGGAATNSPPVRPLPGADATPSPPIVQFKVVSHNVMWEVQASANKMQGKASNTDRLVSKYKQADYDFLCLQECTDQTIQKLKAQLLPSHIILSGKGCQSRRNYSVMIYKNRFEVIDQPKYTCFKLENETIDRGRPAMVAFFRDNSSGRKIAVVSIHAPHIHKTPFNLMKNIQNFLSPFLDELDDVVLAGDFNRDDWNRQRTIFYAVEYRDDSVISLSSAQDPENLQSTLHRRAVDNILYGSKDGALRLKYFSVGDDLGSDHNSITALFE